MCVVSLCLDIIYSVDGMENGRHYRHVIDIDSIDIVDNDIIEIRDFMDGIGNTEILGVGDNVHSIYVTEIIGEL